MDRPERGRSVFNQRRVFDRHYSRAVQDAKIVQTWRAGDRPEGNYSTLPLTLFLVSSLTELSFVQTEVPSDQYEEISEGWYDYYENPLKAMLEKGH